MRVLVTICVLCAIEIGCSGAANAHVGPTFYAAPIDPKTITIDGKGDDLGWTAPWWLPENTIRSDMLGGNVTGGEMPSADDWTMVLKIGLSEPPDNMLYFICQVKDNSFSDGTLKNGEAWQEDSLEILIDANHDGGSSEVGPPRGTTAQRFGIRASAEELPYGPADEEGHTRNWLYGATERAWMSGAPWMVVAVDPPLGTTNVTYAYEGKLALWDLAGDTPEVSKRHVNAEGQTMGFSFQWNDADEAGKRHAQPGMQGPEGSEAWKNADQLADVILIPTWGDCFDCPPSTVTAASWGAIKATFQRKLMVLR